MSETIKTFCRNCTSQCGLEFEVEQGRMISVRGNREHAMTGGYFCVKANASVELAKGGYPRLLHSLKRVTESQFDEVSKNQALDEIADKIRELVARHGPRAIGIFYGTGAYFNGLAWPLMKSFLGELGSPNLFSTMTIDQSASWVAQLRLGTLASGNYGLDEVDTLMLVGNNPVVSHQLLGCFRPGKALADLRRRGADLIVVDPRATETVRHATHHLQLKPGEDATLFSGMIRLILAKGWEDEAFCARHVAGVEDLRRATEPYTPDFVAARTGILPQALEAATERFATAGRSLAMVATGPSMGPHSNLNVHLVQCLNALCGNFRRAGEVVKNRSVLLPRRFVETAIPPSRSWEAGVKCHSGDVGQLFGEFPTGILPDEILTPGEDRIRGLIVLGGNPVTAIGQPDKTLRAFRELELLVTIDPRMTETARMSHYVIAPRLQYERYDLSTVIDGLAGYTKPFVQYTAPVVEPPGEVVDEGEFFWGLARRLGLQLRYKKMILGMDYNRVGDGVELDMDTPPDGELLAGWWCEGTEVNLDELKRHPGGFSPELPETRVEAAEDSGARMCLCPADVAREIDAVYSEAADPDFPYRLITRRLLECLNSLYHDTAQTRQRYPTNFAYMSPEDMAREGIAERANVLIASPHGAVRATARSDKSVPRGVISMAHQWGEPDSARDPRGERGALTGRLVSLDVDVEAINRMPRQSAIPVRVQVA